MPTITLTRTGDRPLKFEGEKVASASSRFAKGQESNRWHELTLYRAIGGDYVLHIAYRSQWEGELDNDFVAALGTDQGAVAQTLRAYNPAGHMALLGEEVPQFRNREARRVYDLRQRYEAAVSELLADMPEELG